MILKILLPLQSLVFLVWAVLMFRTLFRLRRQAVDASGAAIPGLGATLRSFGSFLTAPHWAADRRLLGPLTLALMALTIAIPLLAASPPPGADLLPPPPRN